MVAARSVILAGVLVAVGNASGRAAEFPKQEISADEGAGWLRRVVPLPKQVQWHGKITVRCEEVLLKPRLGSTEIEGTALADLRLALGQKNDPPASSSALPIVVRLVSGPQAAELTKFKNSDQAYAIRPLAEPGLEVTALSPKGLFYGLKTLQQLVEPRVDQGKATVPLVSVVDWPDLEERGLWGGSAERDIAYMADRKMNLIEAHTSCRFEKNGRPVASFNPKGPEAARRRAMKWVPIISHLDHLSRTGLLERYPELVGKGPKAKHRTASSVIVPCCSQPKVAEVLGEWFECLAAAPGVTDVSVWLSEIEGMDCACAECQRVGRWTQETRTAIAAWQHARKKHPQVGLRILLSQGSYPFNDQVLAAAAPYDEVGITYYSGFTTYDSTRDEMIYPLLADWARRGRWLGVYPQLTASFATIAPWTGPQFIKARMTEFVDKGLSCLCGYATPDNRYFDFNVTAAAEWSWNAHGRSEREFALAWATRQRLADPEKAADWAMLIGRLGWDVYGSKIPQQQFSLLAGRMIQQRQPPAWLGSNGMFRHFRSVAEIDADLADCRQALHLAERLGRPAMVHETKVIGGYIRMVKAIRQIATVVSGKKPLDGAAQRTARTELGTLRSACDEVTANLKAWKAVVAPEDRARASRRRST